MILILAATLLAQPSDLIATDAGLYFRQRTGIETESWFLLRTSGVVEPQDPNIVSVSDSGTTIARSFHHQRRCYSGGSTCTMSAGCSTGASLQTPTGTRVLPWRETEIRLDASGKYAWILQTAECSGIGSTPQPTSLNGIYETSTMNRIAAGPVPHPSIPMPLSDFLLKPRIGRRIFSNRGELLYGQYWLGPQGFRRIPLVDPAREAAMDAEGCQIVYISGLTNTLRWFDCGPNSDEDLRIVGEQPALSADGRFLIYLDPTRHLAVYDRGTRTSVNRLLDEPVLSFTEFQGEVFAALSGGSLVRLALADGQVTTLLPLTPVLKGVSTGWTSLPCPRVCYGPVDPEFAAGPGTALLVWGEGFDLSNDWKIQFNGASEAVPLRVTGPSEAIAHVPADALSGDAFVFRNRWEGLRLRLRFRTVAASVSCLYTLHGDLSRRVTDADPAEPGEHVRVVLSGLPEPADAPPLREPEAAEILGLQNDEGQQLQYLDLRILRPFTNPGLFNSNIFALGCSAPPVR